MPTSFEAFQVRAVFPGDGDEPSTDNGIGVERTFLMRSPRIDKVVVERHSKVRRAQLYFMRERTGKSARLKQKFD